MICLNCDRDNFRSTIRPVIQEYKGHLLSVVTPVMVCNDCGWTTVGNDQLDALIANTEAAYQASLNSQTK